MNLNPNEITEVCVELSSPEQMFYRATPFSAAYDLRACQEVILAPGETKAIPTGVKIALPPGFELELRPRSGLSLKSRLRLANSPGTIDADYRGELKVILENRFSQSELPQLIATNSPLLERFGSIGEELSLAEYLTRLDERTGNGDAKQDNMEQALALSPSLAESRIYLDCEGRLWGTEYIAKRERIAQALVKSLNELDFRLVESVAEIGYDRGGGLGHSGRI